MLSGRKVKLLVVDDSGDTCSLLAEQLEAWYDVEQELRELRDKMRREVHRLEALTR